VVLAGKKKNSFWSAGKKRKKKSCIREASVGRLFCTYNSNGILEMSYIRGELGEGKVQLSGKRVK